MRRINEMCGGNQFMAAAISAWLLGVATFFFRKVPQDALALTQKHLTTSMTLTSQNVSFYSLMAWLEKKGYSKKFRRIKITNGRWGDSGITKSVGYGRHLMWHGCIPLLIDLERRDSVADRDKEEITISKLGRSHKLFDTLLKALAIDEEDHSKTTKIRMYGSDECWAEVRQPKRELDSVLIPAAMRTQLIDTVKKFAADEPWYIRHGIPYQLGILLHGPPGTGKTSLIRALAAYLDTGLSVIPASKLIGVSEMGDCKDIIVIEDVDSNKDTGDRLKAKAEIETSISLVKYDGGISEILNALDGIVVSHGRVIIMTTNYIEKLDPALVRPGRVDLNLQLGYVTPEVLGQFVTVFFPEAVLPPGEMCTQTTVAELQNMVMQGKSLDTILSECYTVDK